MNPSRTLYPSDVSDEEWAFVVPYLILLPEDAGQRTYSLREVFNGLRWIVRTGAPWRLMPHDLPPWYVVYQQTQRWLAAGCFAAIVDDLRLLLRQAQGRKPQPSAAIFDSRTLQSTPESGGHAGYDGAKRRKGSKVHAAVDTLGNLLALLVTPANEQERAQVDELAQAVQDVTGQSVELATVTTMPPWRAFSAPSRGDVSSALPSLHARKPGRPSLNTLSVFTIGFVGIRLSNM